MRVNHPDVWYLRFPGHQVVHAVDGEKKLVTRCDRDFAGEPIITSNGPTTCLKCLNGHLNSGSFGQPRPGG